jgi:hypothetical protein
MKKKCLPIGISTVSVILLILTSLTNVVGYQTVQSSNQSVIKERINQRELLFQTIFDITNNKEIQRVILKSQMSRGMFPTSEFPIVTKNQLKMMYFLGLILSKIISKSKIHSMVEQYQFSNQDIQKEISAVIQEDATLKEEITQISNAKCDCENDNITTWFFPVLCTILFPLFVISVILWGITHFNNSALLEIMLIIGSTLNCYWLGG